MRDMGALQAENQALKIELSNLTLRMEQYQQAYENMAHQLKELLRHRFGTRSERDIDPDNPQMTMFTDEMKGTKNQPIEQDSSTEVAAHRRKKKQKNTAHYPRMIEIIQVSEYDKECACGCEKQVIRYETKELYHYKPAEFGIIEQRREVVACPKGCQKSIVTAPAPGQVLPKVKASEALLAHIVVAKMHHRQPLYHLEKYGQAMEISRETMARWVIDLIDPLQPLYNLMKDEVIDYNVGSIDATTLQVLKEPGRKAQKKSYVYCIRGGTPDKSVVLYDYNYVEHKYFTDSWFEGFKGTLHMDADPFFDLLISHKHVKANYCNAHARRKFESIAKQSKKLGLAHQAVQFYKKLYQIERLAKKEGYSSGQRYQLRQEKSLPIIKDFREWLVTNQPLVLPKSPLGKAIKYCIKHWEGLIMFLEDGRLEIDNNLTEQEIKPFVISRKNFMFADTMAGARALCMHFSLIRTALLHKLDPYQYYVMILKKLPYCQQVEDYEKLLPWHIELPKTTPTNGLI